MASLDPDGAVLFGRRTAGGPTFPDIDWVVHPRQRGKILLRFVDVLAAVHGVK
jgi:hypothetical protein